MKDQAFLDFLRAQQQSKFNRQRPDIKRIARKLSAANGSFPSKEFTIDMCEQLLYCHQLLGLKTQKKKVAKPHRSKLTSREKLLFDGEDYLSAYQNIIANASGSHRHRQQDQGQLSHSSIDHRQLPIHRFCRKGLYPDTSIARQQMTDDQVLWIVDLPNYKPPYYTHPSLLEGALDADPESMSANFMWNTFDTNHHIDRRTANPTGRYAIDAQGYPLNPLGRTGLCGRGVLKRWGVNYQTHLVIMCGTNEMKSGKEVFKYIMHTSKEDSYDHLPTAWTTGTNMNAIKMTLKTFLSDIYRAWNDLDDVNDDKTKEIIEHLTFVSTAYIDDSKNTDNAWLETSVCCYIQTHRNEAISSNPSIDLNKLFPDPPLSHKTTYTWRAISSGSKLLDSERDVLKLIANRYNAYW